MQTTREKYECQPTILSSEWIWRFDKIVGSQFLYSMIRFSKLQCQFYTIVSERLQYSKIGARCVLKMLPDYHKTRQISVVLMFLQRYRDEGDFLNQIVSGYETWTSFETEETKEQSKQMINCHSPRS